MNQQVKKFQYKAQAIFIFDWGMVIDNDRVSKYFPSESMFTMFTCPCLLVL